MSFHREGGVWVGHEPLCGCLCPVVFLGDFRPVTNLGDEFLLGEDQVGEPGIEFPDGVEKIEFFFGRRDRLRASLEDLRIN